MQLKPKPHFEWASVNLDSVQTGNGGGGGLLVCHFHKSETKKLACCYALCQIDILHRSESPHHPPKLIFRYLRAHVAHKQPVSRIHPNGALPHGVTCSDGLSANVGHGNTLADLQTMQYDSGQPSHRGRG